MDYDLLIQETKKALESYSSANSKLEELYRSAKEKNTESYDIAKQSLSQQYSSDRNAAVSKGMLDEKDYQQFLAARGLSSSGESVQAKIDSNISINNTLGELAKENTKALSSLERERLDSESKLEGELGEKQLEQDKWQTELAAKIAQLKQSAEDKKQTSGKDSGDDNTDTTDNVYTPATSAKELAKSIVSTYSSDGKVNTALQKSYISLYLNSLSKDQNVDAAYLKELMINLKASGYTDLSVAAAEANIAVSKSKAYYKETAEKLFAIYQKGNRTLTQAKKMAESQARTLMLDYMYERCSTLGAFERACRQAGVTESEIKEYYKRLDNIIENGSTTLTLGSKTSY